MYTKIIKMKGLFALKSKENGFENSSLVEK